MKPPSGDALHELAAHPAGPCLSVYLPIGPWDAQGRQAQIRWKNLLRKAGAALVEAKVAAAQADEVLREAKGLDPVAAHGGRAAGGLAVFAARGFLRSMPLPVEPAEEVVVGDRFHLKPMLEALAEPPRFYVLAFSQNRVRLLDATPTNATEIPLPGCPPTLAAALRLEEHDASGSGAGGDDASGDGAAGDGAAAAHKNEVLRFARQVAPHVKRAVERDPRCCLVLACVDPLAPILRETIDVPHLESEFVRGNPDRLRCDELAARAWDIVRDCFGRATTNDVERFRALAGTGRTAGSVEEVLSAALQGRVETLFVAADRNAWGAFDTATRRVTLHDRPAPEDHDLLDDAAVAVLEQGAVLHVMPGGDMPEGALAAAILRY